MSGISPTSSLLNSYDPTNPASIDQALASSNLSDRYYTQGANGTGTNDPGTEGPTAVPLTQPTPSSVATSGPNVYQQALASLQQWSDQTLITSALSSGTSTSGDDSSSLISTLESAAESQQADQAAQQQAALAAAQTALNAGTQIDTTA